MNIFCRAVDLARWRRLVSLTLAGFISGCCFCPVPPGDVPAPVDSWHEFTSVEGNFRASFPKRPELSASDDGLEQRYTAELRNREEAYRAAYELSANPTLSPMEKMKLTARELQAENVSIHELQLQGHPGAEGIYTTVDGPHRYHVRHRIYHVDTTVYQVMVVVGNAEPGDDADRFFDSFQLLESSP